MDTQSFLLKQYNFGQNTKAIAHALTSNFMYAHTHTHTEYWKGRSVRRRADNASMIATGAINHSQK